MINSKYLDFLKNKYPIGTRIKLLNMNDRRPVPKGTLGTVDFIDSERQIHMKWDNGSSLAIIYGVDEFIKVKDREKQKER